MLRLFLATPEAENTPKLAQLTVSRRQYLFSFISAKTQYL